MRHDRRRSNLDGAFKPANALVTAAKPGPAMKRVGYALPRGTIMAAVAAAVLGSCAFFGRPTVDIDVLSDQVAPTITITSHQNGDPYLSTTTISGTATDHLNAAGAPGSVTAIRYDVPDENLGGTVVDFTDGTFVFSFDTQGVVGPIRVRVTATDHNGNTAEAAVHLTAPSILTSFSFLAAHNQDSGLPQDVEGTISGRTVIVSLPRETDVRSLAPSFEMVGPVMRVAGLPQASGVTRQDFTSAVEYHVIANDGTFSVYTVLVSAAPLSPTGLSAEAVSDREVTVTWTDQSHNETRFVLQRKNGADGTFVTVAELDPGTGEYADVPLVPEQVYHYRVCSRRGDLMSSWSEESSVTPPFPPPELVDPADGSTVTETTQIFDWSDVQYADGYEIQIGDSRATRDAAELIATGTSYYENTDPLPAAGIVYWRVRAVNVDGATSSWASGTCTMDWGRITWSTPTGGTTTRDTAQLLRWDCADNVDVSEYQLQITTAEQAIDKAPIVSVTPQQYPQYRPGEPYLNYTDYYWRVRAVDQYDQRASWSEVNMFSVSYGTVTTMSPNHGISIEPDDYLQWSLEGDAHLFTDHYELRISSTESAIDDAPIVLVDHGSYAPTDQWPKGSDLYWQITPVDDRGRRGTPSPVADFSVLEYVVGDTGPAGGVVFYYKTDRSDGWQYLEAAREDCGGSSIQWGGGGTDINGPDETVPPELTGLGSGKQNTQSIVSALGNNGGVPYAAQICDDLILGGYDDWYLPSRDELDLLGERQTHIGGLTDPYFYWSSSEASADKAWLIWFIPDHTEVSTVKKEVDGQVRPIRSF